MFFKFREINKYLIDSLVKGTIYCASPSKLNDPFDCRVDIKKAVNQAILNLSGEKKRILSKLANMKGYLDQIQKDTGDVALCSFSLVLAESLLWSHYANQHRGLCLTYEFSEDFLNNPDSILGAVPVEYEDNSLTNWFIENTPTEETEFKKFTLEIVKKVLTIKSPSWGYEKEFRIIRKQAGAFEIEKEQLIQICFGLNTAVSDINRIRQLVDSSGYTVEYCKMVRSQSDFGIEAQEI